MEAVPSTASQPLQKVKPSADGCSRGCDDGWIVVPREHGADDSWPCECRTEKIRRRQTQKAQAGIPKAYRDVAIDRNPFASLDPRGTGRLKAYVRHLDDKVKHGRGCWIWGQSGIGKTCAAALIAKEAGELQLSYRFYVVGDLLGEIKKRFRDDSDQSEQDFIDDIAGVDLLILDDVGSEHTSPWVMTEFFRIINRRYNDERSLVLTTSLPPDELARRLGFTTIRRLHDRCGAALELAYPPGGA